MSEGRRLTSAIFAVFFLSGISGLLYQVIWVRWFGRLLGNTVYSASIVIAVFMCGLGVGSYLAGRWVDRRDRGRNLPLRAYGYAELAIAALGAGLAFLLPRLEPLAAYLTSYERGETGFFEVTATSMLLRFAIAVVLLAPVTTLMGATLALLAKHVLRDNLAASGWRIGLLYGFNTAGAALGAFASDFALIPSLGLLSTQLFAVLLNLTAGLAALRMARVTPPAPIATESGTTDDGDASPRLVRATSAALFFSGFCAMGVEILWFRQFHIGLGGYRAVFSLLLTVVLVGMWLGSLAGGWAHKRWGRPAVLYAVSHAAFLIATVALLSWVSIKRGSAVVSAEEFQHSWSLKLRVAAGVLEPIALIAGIPSFLMGFAYPLANANIQRAEAASGRRAGLLYLANTVGAVSGSVITGFVLIPALGLKGSIAALGVVTIVAVLSLALGPEPGPGRRPVLATGAIAAAAAALALVLWNRVPPERFTHFGILEGEKVLSVNEGIYELVVVTELPGGIARRLKTNGHNMSGTDNDAQRYMRGFVHIPLLHMEEPSDVLVICFGVGSTLHAASLHPSVERIEAVDLSRNVLSQAHYFEESNHGAIDHPKVHVYINDGRQHLWTRPERTYDLITLEPPPISFSGVSALYSREFYRLARSRLKDGGFMSQWLPAYQLPEDAVRSLVRSFVDVFPNAILISGFRQELILIGSRSESLTIDPRELARRIRDNPALRDDLEAVKLGSLTEIIGSFVAASDRLEAATRDAWPVTDDHPLMEYAAPATNCHSTRFPRDLIDTPSFERWCPRCVESGQTIPIVGPLGDYLRQHHDYYTSERFLHYTTCPWLDESD